MCAADAGMEKVKAAYEARLSLNDGRNLAVFARLEHINSLLHPLDIDIASAPLKLQWHKQCYATFTSKGHINRLRKKEFAPQEGLVSQPCSSSSSILSRSRSSTNPTDWSACILCQKFRLESLHQPESNTAMNGLQAMLANDEELFPRVAGVDLIAFKAKYHASCYMQQKRKENESQNISTKKIDVYDIAFKCLTNELDQGFENGHVYELTEVRDRYIEILQSHDTEAYSYRSEKMKERLSKHYGSRIEICPQTCKNNSFLIFRHMPVHKAVEALRFTTSLLKEQEAEEGLPSDHPDDVFLR